MIGTSKVPKLFDRKLIKKLIEANKFQVECR